MHDGDCEGNCRQRWDVVLSGRNVSAFRKSLATTSVIRLPPEAVVGSSKTSVNIVGVQGKPGPLWLIN